MSDLEDKLKELKFPAWSAFVLVPLFILACSFNAIRKSGSPAKLALVALGVSLVCAVIACGILVLLERMRK